MKTPSPIALLLLVPLLALPGCLSDGLDIGLEKAGEIFNPGGMFDGEPQFVLAEAGEVPPEVPTVLSALMLRLRGQPAIDAARFFQVSGSEGVTPEETFRYEGFAVRRVLIDQFEVDAEQPEGRRLAGQLYLEDPMGRATSVAFDLAYSFRDQGLHIHEASWTPALAKEPRTALFIVPRQAIEQDLGKADNSYRGLYALVLEKALPVKSAAALPRRAHDYLLFVFFEDRLAPKAEVELRIGKSPDQSGGYAGASSLIAFPDGWAVGVISGRFRLSREDPYWVKVSYRPVTESQSDLFGLDLVGPERIGSFPVPPPADPSS